MQFDDDDEDEPGLELKVALAGIEVDDPGRWQLVGLASELLSGGVAGRGNEVLVLREMIGPGERGYGLFHAEELDGETRRLSNDV